MTSRVVDKENQVQERPELHVQLRLDHQLCFDPLDRRERPTEVQHLEVDLVQKEVARGSRGQEPILVQKRLELKV